MTDLKMETWKSKRGQWQEARNTAKVAKGAVSSVSIGDDLDGIYSAAKKGYTSLVKAVEKAEKDIATYQTKGGKAVQPVAVHLKTLTTDLAALKKAAQADAKLLAQLLPYLQKFHSLHYPGTPSAEDWLALERVMKGSGDQPGLDWAAAVKDRDFWYQMPATLKAYDATVKALRGLTFQVELRGKQTAYAGVVGQYKSYAKTLDLL